MKLFLDTSSLVKLYYQEEGTEALDKFLKKHSIEAIYLSEISKVELGSAIWKKLRMREIEESDATALLNGFQEDYNRYKFIAVNAAIVNRASNLIVKYGAQGLRTLDAIQLSCAIEERNQITVAKTSDEKLEDFLKQEGIG